VDRRVLGWTVVAGALSWSVVQARWVWVKPRYYVTPPEPPAPGGGPAQGGPTAPSQGPVRDPETRPTRG
jgi:hypothetical protein